MPDNDTQDDIGALLRRASSAYEAAAASHDAGDTPERDAWIHEGRAYMIEVAIKRLEETR